MFVQNLAATLCLGAIALLLGATADAQAAVPTRSAYAEQVFVPCVSGTCVADFPALNRKQKLEVHRAICVIDAPSANLSDVQIFTGNPPSFQFFYNLALDSEEATPLSLYSQDGTFITLKRGDPVKAFFQHTGPAPQNSVCTIFGEKLTFP